MTRFFTAAAAMLMNTAAPAQDAHVPFTGDKWIKLCSDGAPLTDLVSCGSYARGIGDMVQIMQQAAPEVAKACIPYDKTGNDLATAAFPLIAKLPPSDRAKPAVVLLWGAFMLAYPCR
jgi:Rap1a immunity proteins